MDQGIREILRQLPSVEELSGSHEAGYLLAAFPREMVVQAVRDAVSEARQAILSAKETSVELDGGGLVAPEALLERTAVLLKSWSSPGLKRVLNATGVVVHTNLGRSLLAQPAIDRMVEVAAHYSNLEYNLESGERGSRQQHVEGLLRRLTGAESALVVNNNAAAVLLLLSALATGREVVVSRGQLVEIGGSFRIPDIMRLSGARLVEVGTTNKTRLEDYREAITADTALLLRVHTSNFRVVGFAEEVSVEELCRLGDLHGLPVADDLGSGVLLDLPVVADEPSVRDSLQAGAAAVTFSGDKLLGGPQAGILLGSAEFITRLKRHPLARAVRVDKLTLAALEGTLLLYQDPQKARRLIPTLACLDRTPEVTGGLARSLLAALAGACEEDADLRVEETIGRAGGGSLPLVEVPSHAVTVRPRQGNVVSLEGELRRAPLPVLGRVAQDALHLDVLALREHEIPLVAEAVARALADTRTLAGPAQEG